MHEHMKIDNSVIPGVESIIGKKLLAPARLSQKQRGTAWLLIQIDSGHWIRTNSTGKRLVELCDGVQTVGEVTQTLATEYGMPAQQILQALLPFIQGALEIGFLRDVDTPARAASENVSDAQETLELWLHVTNRCNMACRFCVQGGPRDDDPGELLTLRDYETLFAQLKDVKNLRVKFSGGEPLLRPDFPEIVRRCREITGPATRIVIVTNGTGASIEIYLRLAKIVDLVQISLDGASPEVHDAIRGAGSFKKIMALLDETSQAGLKNIWLSFTPTLSNYKDMPRMVNLCLRKRVSGLHINKLMPGGRAKEGYEDILVPKEEFERIVAKLYAEYQSQLGWSRTHVSKQQQPPPLALDPAFESASSVSHPNRASACGWGRFIVSIDAGGNVFPCPSLNIPEFRRGNIREDGFWAVYTRLKQDVAPIAVDVIPECAECDIRYVCSGGCRARAYHLTGDVKQKDPQCNYERYIDRMFEVAPYIVTSNSFFHQKAIEQHAARAGKDAPSHGTSS